MVKLTEIIGSQVVSIFNGKNEGYIASAQTTVGNFKKIAHLKLIDEETETAKSLNVKDIYSLSSGYVLIKNASKILVSVETEKTDELSLVNKTAINLSGQPIGIIKDVLLDEKFNINSIVCLEQEIGISKIVSIGSSFVIVNPEEVRITSNRFKPRTPIDLKSAEEDTRTITIAKSTISDNDLVVAPNKYPTTPIKFTSSNSYLIGKRVSRDIVSLSGELIIRKSSIITAKAISLAKHFNKLKELVSFAY